jgi:predicted ATPase/two-component sensor histidine kinase/GAF domain-containing protein
MELAGYVLEPLRIDSDSTLYRGRQAGNAVPILVLAPSQLPQAPGHVRRLEHEVSLAGELDPAWAACPRRIVRQDRRAMLILEDPGGEPMSNGLGRPLELTHFLHVAVGLAAALRKVHEQGLVHKDIKPANVLLDSAGNVRLMGFGIASGLPRELQAPMAPQVIAGTLAYMAPEQTGRMNRSIDSRSDLYSLGVTLYEMLTGTLPFAASDPMELIHCHIARQPAPPSTRVGNIPEPVEAIILKLLAKTAEDRYQTAAGVEADLRRCLTAWQLRRRIDPFRPGDHDVSDRLLIPERLYGREREIETLVAAFDRVVADGAAELVLVSGYSGIGKSSVVNELHKVLVPPRGLFAAGKFDQYKRDIPYATLAQAFQSLVRRLLGQEDDIELGRWRQALLEALGQNGELIIKLIPELVAIIGEQPPVPDLPPQDAQSRFQTVFRRFLGVFARPEHPLALFLDDLQWLDAATLDLLERLIVEQEVKHLLLVGAYRSNEVGPSHPLMRTLAVVRQAGERVNEIVLAPLSPSDVARLVADALHAEPAHVRPLAELVFDRTAGNPFFAIQFTIALADEKLLAFDAELSVWRWDFDRIQAKGFTANVADLMAAKLNRLPASTRQALGLLACLGNIADFDTLALVHGGPQEELRAALWQAARAGLIFRLDGSYAFVHDRVQEAAYALIPDDQRGIAHLRIGRLLVSRTAPEELGESIFDIVNQLNRGAGLIDGQEEREQFATLNLIAGKRAKAATAYASALQYFAIGRGLLAQDEWERCYRLTFDLEFNWGECEYLTGELRSAEQRLAALSARACNTVDLAAVTCVRINLHTTLDQGDRAVEVGLEYLRRIDDGWPLQVTAEHVREDYDRLWELLGSSSIESLVELPLMDDLELRGTMDVLTVLTSPAMYSDENLFRLIVVRMANLSLQHGNSDGACFAYVWLGAVLSSHFGDYPAGLDFGRLGLDLVERFGLDRFRARVYIEFGHRLAPWMQHLSTCRPYVRRAFHLAQEVSDLTYATYSCSILVTHLLASGERLDAVQREAEHGLEFAQNMQFGFIVDIITGQLRLIRMLRGLTPDFASFKDAEFDENRFEQHLGSSPQLKNAACCYWIYKLQSCYHAADFASAVAAASRAAPLLWTAPSQFEVADYHFYAALARAAICDASSAEEGAEHLAAVAAHHAQLALWASHCPENFGSRATLAAAEIARIERRDQDAMHLYEDAIRSAREHGFVQNEGLGNELAARFHAARGFETIAEAYLVNAHACYLRWGADGKIAQLERAHPLPNRAIAPSPPSGTIGTPVELLDLATVVKLSQAISGEIDLDRLIDTLMVIALEHAGGDRGLLILAGAEPLIEAEAVIENDTVKVTLGRAPVSPDDLPESVLRYVIRTQESLLLGDASSEAPFCEDEFVRRNLSRSVLCLPLIKQTKLVGVLYIENGQLSHVFTPARIAVLSLLASQAAISLENARLYTDLRHTEAYLAEAQRLSRTGSFAFSVSSGEVFWSDEVYRIYEYDRTTKITLEINLQRTHPEEEASIVQKILDRVPADGRDCTIEHRLLMPDGSVKNLHVVVHSENGEGADLKYVGTVMDVTESRQAQERLQASLDEKEALLKEVHHRVKNNLQLISSLLNLQAARILDSGVAEKFAESRNRVRAMAMVHENLYRSGNFARVLMRAHIQRLCADLIRAYGMHSAGVDLKIDIDDVQLDLDRAISIGLIINELVSNALKHAFPNGRPGLVRVDLKLAQGRHCVLTVQDDGIGVPVQFDPERADSLGLQLVQDLTDQLHGEISLSRDRGSRFNVSFDVNGLAGAVR